MTENFNNKASGVLLISWGVLFTYLETNYFGNNWTPQSLAELICDGIGAAVCLLGFFCLIKKSK